MATGPASRDPNSFFRYEQTAIGRLVNDAIDRFRALCGEVLESFKRNEKSSLLRDAHQDTSIREAEWGDAPPRTGDLPDRAHENHDDEVASFSDPRRPEVGLTRAQGSEELVGELIAASQEVHGLTAELAERPGDRDLERMLGASIERLNIASIVVERDPSALDMAHERGVGPDEVRTNLVDAKFIHSESEVERFRQERANYMMTPADQAEEMADRMGDPTDPIHEDHYERECEAFERKWDREHDGSDDELGMDI